MDDFQDVIRETTVEHLCAAEKFWTSETPLRKSSFPARRVHIFTVDWLHREHSLIFCEGPVDPREHKNNDRNPLTFKD